MILRFGPNYNFEFFWYGKLGRKIVKKENSVCSGKISVEVFNLSVDLFRGDRRIGKKLCHLQFLKIGKLTHCAIFVNFFIYVPSYIDI